MGFFDWFSAKKNKDNADDAGAILENAQDIQGKDEVQEVSAELRVQDERETEAQEAEEQESAETVAVVRQDMHRDKEVQDQACEELKIQNQNRTEAPESAEEVAAENDTRKDM